MYNKQCSQNRETHNTPVSLGNGIIDHSSLHQITIKGLCNSGESENLVNLFPQSSPKILCLTKHLCTTANYLVWLAPTITSHLSISCALLQWDVQYRQSTRGSTEGTQHLACDWSSPCNLQSQSGQCMPQSYSSFCQGCGSRLAGFDISVPWRMQSWKEKMDMSFF